MLQNRIGRKVKAGRFQNLLKKHENRDIELFSSHPEKRTPEKKGIRWFVQGGPIPAFTKQHSVKFTDVLYIDRENLEIKFRIASKASYIGIPVINAEAEGVLSIKSLNEIKLTYTHLGTWLIVGTSVWKKEWLIDYIDLDNKVLGAYWAVKGGGPLCGGGGSGYLLAKFKTAEVTINMFRFLQWYWTAIIMSSNTLHINLPFFLVHPRINVTTTIMGVKTRHTGTY